MNIDKLVFKLAGSLILVAAIFLQGCNGFLGIPHRHAPFQYETIKAEFSTPICPHGDQESPNISTACKPGHPISLLEAIKTAQKNNTDIQIAHARVLQADAAVKQANALFWPTVSAYTQFLRGDAPSSFLFKKIDQRTFLPQTDFNAPGIIKNFETGIQLTFNLFNGGRSWLNRQMAEHSKEISLTEKKAAENTIMASVIITYYNALAAEDFVRIAEESLKTVTEQLRIMNVRFQEGGALKSDILTLKVRLSRAREDILKRTNQHRIILASLNQLLGFSIARPVTLKHAEELSADFPGTFEEGVKLALLYRPELKILRQKVELARMGYAQARTGFLPRVDFQSKYYVDDPDFDYDRDRENWMLAIMLNWDIFTGLTSLADQNKALAAIEEALAADRKMISVIELDVKTAYLQFNEAKERLEVARGSVEMAKESFSLVKKQYEGGSATITRYLEAELAYNTARSRERNAFYDKEKAKADIKRSIGLLDMHTKT